MKHAINTIIENVIDCIKEYYHVIIFATISACIAIMIIFAIHQSAIQPKEGVVVRKDYYPAYTSTEYQIIHNGNTTTRIPMQKRHEAKYQIVIRVINQKGEEDLGYYNVTPIEYENIKIGDYYIKQMK